MQPIPQNITDISVYPYIPNVPIEVPASVTAAKGTYSVGTLLTHVFYNLNLESAKTIHPLSLGGMYYAVATDASGKTFSTHWMYCTQLGSDPKFGLTRNLINDGNSAPMIGGDEGPYIDLGDMSDVSVSQEFPPPAIGMIELINGAKGKLIGTRVGTPHLMGIAVENNEPSRIHEGMKLITAGGTLTRTGQEVRYSNMTCVDAGNPAIFLQTFP